MKEELIIPYDKNVWEKKKLIFENLLNFLQIKVDLFSDWKILEFGVGKYGFAGFYNQLFYKVYGLDIEDYSKYHPGVEFLIYDGNSPIPLENNSVDMVVSHSVLEHVLDLDFCLSEINRIVRIDGIIYLTVDPLYYSSFGNHVYKNNLRLDNWEHLIKGSDIYLTDNPYPDASTKGHYLNKLTSCKFLNSVSQQPWNIEYYWLDFEKKRINERIEINEFNKLELLTKGFRFIGRKINDI